MSDCRFDATAVGKQRRRARRPVLAMAAVLTGLAALAGAAAGQPAAGVPAEPAERYRAVLERYCVACHNERLRTANLRLDHADPGQVGEAAEVWERVLQKLQAREMPPAGRPRPDDATYDAFAGWLAASLDRAAAAQPNPGRSAPVHRLNRAEYTNAVRDLLAVEIDGRALLPADDASYGFDNIGDVLTMSQPLLERYLSAAQRISRLAVGDRDAGAGEAIYAASRSFRQDDRMNEELPFGTRGGITLRHNFPVDAEYSIRIELQRAIMSGRFKGIGDRRVDPADRHPIDVRLDGRLVGRFSVGPADIVGGVESTGGLQALQQLGTELLVRVPVQAGRHAVAVTFPRRAGASEGLRLPLPTRSFSHNDDAGGLPAIASVTVGGPYDAAGVGHSPSRRRIFICRPAGAADEAACAERILSALARRAYRRPVGGTDVDPLLRAYRARRLGGGDFDAGVQAGLAAVLVSPHFLFRVERDPSGLASGTPYRLDDLAVASRLSFFLWSSIPDDELLGLAERGELSEPDILAGQVRRMLADARAAALVDNFFGQWLYLRNLGRLQPDAELYPAFDDGLRDAFRRETELFLASQLREDRSVVDLLRAPDTFLNERLAAFYGVPNVYGSHFRRVALPDGRRAGLLGHGSILTATSYANRTSPVLRGKFVLEAILGAPPPPPPPDVPALEDAGAAEQPRSTRERLEQHRRNPACATCHAKIDPLGFALENFDPIGAWRETDNGVAVDASGTTADGASFDGPLEFRQALLAREDLFVANVVRKLLTYALGRGLEHYDQPAVRRIMRQAGEDDYRWSALIGRIVASPPFQMRSAQ